MKAIAKSIQWFLLAVVAGPWANAETQTTPPPVPSGARNENLPALIRDAEKGVFFIRVLDAGGKPISMGTGFLVDDKGAVLTSLHVMRPTIALASSAEAVGVDGKTHAVKGITASDESLDLALLQLEAPPEGAVPVALAGDQPPERGAYVADLARPEAELREIVGKFKTEYPRYLNGIQAGSRMPGAKEKTPPTPPTHPAEACLPKLLALAEANPGSGLEYRALETLMMIACGRGCPAAVADDVNKASDRLIAGFRDQRRILTIIRNRPTPTLPAALDFLRGLAGKSSDPEVRAFAAFLLASTLDLNSGDATTREEALKSARLAAACPADFMIGRNPLATVAGELVAKLTRSAVGWSAPELTGTDRAGKPFKLADVLGQYVVVAFWNKRGDFFDHTSKTLDEITTKYSGSPLAVVGVGLRDSSYSSNTQSEAKETPWKFIADGEDEVLRKAWHITAVPTFFLLDPQGLIIGRYQDVPAHTMLLGNGMSSMFSYSSSGSFGSNLNGGTWKSVLTKAIEQIPAIAEPRRKIMSLVTSGPWLAPDGWDSTGSGGRTVFFREDGSTSVKWIASWELRTPAGLHLHLLPRSSGCTEMDVDLATAEARVKSPASLAGRCLKLRDFPAAPAPETAARRSVRELLLAEEWSWYASGKPGAQPAYMKFRFKPDGTTNSTLLTAWEVTPAGQVRAYLYDGRYWAFDLNIEKNSARSNLADSQIKDHKAFAVGAVAPDTTPGVETAAVPAMIPRPQNASAAQIDLSKYYNGGKMKTLDVCSIIERQRDDLFRASLRTGTAATL